MPIASAMVDPLLSARMARPGRESSSRLIDSAASSAIEPDQHVQRAAGAEIDAECGQRRNAEDAVVFAQPLHVGHRVVQHQAPGDGGERQVVPRHAQRDGAEQQRGQDGQRHADRQRQPWRQAARHGQEGGGVGADADEGGLPERSQPGHTGQHDESQRDDRVQPDVVALGDPEVGHRQRRQHEHQQRKGREAEAVDGRGIHPAGAATLRAAVGKAHDSSRCGSRSERHSSTGRMAPKTITSLNELAQNEPKLSSRPTPSAPTSASG